VNVIAVSESGSAPAAYLGLGHLQRAQNLLEASIARVPDADWVGTQSAWLLLGDVRRELGDLEGARAAHRRALGTAEANGMVLAAARAQAALGRDALAAGRPGEAVGLIESAIAVFEAGSYRRELAEAR
jgi:tetratricopeptide (TPR) repeat protein